MINFIKRLFKVKNIAANYSAFPSLQEHRERGETTCPKCNKNFISSIIYCTRDVVHKFDKPGRLCTTEAYCPHCDHSFEVGYTPMSSVLEKVDQQCQ